MLYRLMRDWRGYRQGKVFEPQPGVAQILLRRQIIEPVGEGSQESEARSQKTRSKRKS